MPDRLVRLICARRCGRMRGTISRPQRFDNLKPRLWQILQ